MLDNMPDNFDILKRLANASEVDENWIAFNAPKKEEPEAPAPDAELGDADLFNQPETQAAVRDVKIISDGTELGLRNELADAMTFVQHITGKAWYCSALAASNKSDVESGWLTWDGKRLSQSDNGAMMRLAKKVALALTAECMTEVDELNKKIAAEHKLENPDTDKIRDFKAKQSRALSRADQLQTEKRMRSMISLARIEESILIDHDELDANPDILNCQNGVVNLKNGELLPHDPAFRCTRITGVPYHKDADRKILDQLLNRALMTVHADQPATTDHARIDFLQQSIGHALYGHQRLQKFYLCIGDGGDGKGTLFEALLDCLGDYAIKADMQSFVKQKLSGHRIRDDVANMAGARIVVASEINRGDALDGAFMKTISGEDKQRVRHLFGKEFEFRPICTLFMQSNHQPYVDSQDHAIWRRLVNIPFGPSLTEAERDPNVRRALHDPETGGAALLAWAIEGAIETYDIQRIPEPESVLLSTSHYRHDMNPLASFIIEDLRFSIKELAEQTFVEQRAIKKAFEEWLAASGLDDKRGNQISGSRIAAQLRACGAYAKPKKIEGKARKCWFGVTLRKGVENRAEVCHDTKTPTIEIHMQQLAASKAIEVTWLPQLPLQPTHAHEKNTMAFFDEPAHAHNEKGGNQVTDNNNIKNINLKNINNQEITFPDLDSLEDDGDGLDGGPTW